jgi:hypothetical protein
VQGTKFLIKQCFFLLRSNIALGHLKIKLRCHAAAGYPEEERRDGKLLALLLKTTAFLASHIHNGQ